MLSRWQNSRPTALRPHSFIPSLRPELGLGPVCRSKQNFYHDSSATTANCLLGSSTRNPSPSTSASFPAHHHKPSSISATVVAIVVTMPSHLPASSGTLQWGKPCFLPLPIKMLVWLFFHV